MAASTYTRGELLGQGSYASVYLGTDSNGIRVALKIRSIKQSRLDIAAENKEPRRSQYIASNLAFIKQQVDKEAEVLRRINSDYVIKYIETIVEEISVTMITEFVEGSELTSTRVAPYQIDVAQDLIRGLHDIHRCGIIHCDIKSDNILVSQRERGWTVKYLDFGLARYSHEQTSQGTLMYTAPEILHKDLSTDFKVDIYSLGVVLFELFHHSLPGGSYSSEGLTLKERLRAKQDVVRRIRHGILERSHSGSQIIDHIIDSMLSFEAIDRPLTGDLLRSFA